MARPLGSRDERIGYIRSHSGKPIRLTDAALTTWDLANDAKDKYALQARMPSDLSDAPGERYCFYSLLDLDLDPARDAIEGFTWTRTSITCGSSATTAGVNWRSNG